jgi:hypothetical protein
MLRIDDRPRTQTICSCSPSTINPQCLSEAERLDTDMVDVEDERQRYGAYTQFKIAVDFGTTYSSVAVLGLVDSQPQKRIHPEDIHVITQYSNPPEGENHPRLDVPTECWYGILKPTMKKVSARNDRLLNPIHVWPSSSAASSNEIESDEEAMADMEADLCSSPATARATALLNASTRSGLAMTAETGSPGSNSCLTRRIRRCVSGEVWPQHLQS